MAESSGYTWQVGLEDDTNDSDESRAWVQYFSWVFRRTSFLIF